MKPQIIIIARPDIDFSTYLGIGLKVFGRSLGTAADVSAVDLSDSSRFLSCLASMRNPKASVDLNSRLLPHVAFSLLIVADELDMWDILEYTAGMPFVSAETSARGVLMTVISGSLAQWKIAVLAGSNFDTEETVRYTFNFIYGLFREEGLNLWVNFQQRTSPDRVTFFLEDKR